MQIDGKLIDGLIAQNSAAQRSFWEACFQPVLSVCTRTMGPGPKAVDVTTDLLNDFIFHYVHNLSHPEGAWSYLKLMAIRRSVREKQRVMKTEAFENQTVRRDDGAFSEADVRVMMPRLEECLETLTPKAQSVIRMKYTRGSSNEQIGRVVGGSKQYIGRLLQKSLELLRECLHRKEVAND